MIGSAEWAVRIDQVVTRADTGELAKLGQFLGHDVHVTGDEDGCHVTISSRDPRPILDEAAGLILVAAQVHDLAPEQVWQRVRDTLVRWHAPIDKPFSDSREIGAGHDDHEHD